MLLDFRSAISMSQTQQNTGMKMAGVRCGLERSTVKVDFKKENLH